MALNGISHPIIGYYGTLTNSNDWNLIKFLAKSKPDYNFVFIGKIREDVDPEVFDFSNIHFLGYKPYKKLPRYLKFFDVCIIFWKVTDWIINSNPLKTKEFLSMGKPIVSVRIYELEKNFHDIIYLCDTKEEFLSSIDSALAEDSNRLPLKRISKVKDNTWEKDACRIIELFEETNV